METSDHRAAVTPFRIYARVRPFIPEEIEAMTSSVNGVQLRSVIEMRGTSTILLDPKNGYQPKMQFDFDGSWWSIPPSMPVQQTFADQEEHRNYISQNEVYEIVGAGSVDDLVLGYNSCIMSYGQTGSGKTYTMMGNYDIPSERGVISRLCNDLFNKVRTLRKAATAEAHPPTYVVEVNFIEVYMERVRDLLDPSAQDPSRTHESRVRQHPVSGPYIEGVTKYTVETWEECSKLLERGSRQRRTCQTLVHNQSSRSHAIFQITLIQEVVLPKKDKYSEPIVKRKAGRINLVDLAGSERGGTTDYVKESAMINKSLLALRRVIDTLTTRQMMIFEEASAELQGKEVIERVKPQVPFRDSVLTWVLSDSIGGNAKTVMIATLSPYERYYLDTLATLQWSHKARSLVTVVKANDVTSNSKFLKGMQDQKQELNNALSSQQQNVENVRKELQRRQEIADQIETNNEKMKESIQNIRQRRELLRMNGTASVIQLSYRTHDVKKRLLAKRNAHATYEANVHTLDTEIRDIVLRSHIAQEETKTADARQQQLKERIVEIQARLLPGTTNTNGDANLEELRGVALAQSTESTRQLRALEQEYEAEERTMEEACQKLRNAKSEIEKEAQQLKKNTERAAQELAELEQRSATERERLQKEMDSLHAGIQLQEQVLPTLQSRLNELRKEKESLTRQCRELDMKNEKASKSPFGKKRTVTA